MTRGRGTALALSAGLHLLILVGLFFLWSPPPSLPQSAPILVTLAPPFPPVIHPAPTPTSSKAPPATAAHARARPAPIPPDVEPLPARDRPTPEPGLELSEAEAAGASGVGEGPPGGGCDMARALQAALRKDPLVQAAVAPGSAGAASPGKVLRVWNGEWISHPGQDGKGLAAVREAVMWEIAFAPRACRDTQVRGLVVLSLADAPLAPRLAVGAGAWRWSDLIAPTPGFREPRALR